MVEAGEPGAILEALPDVGCEVNLAQSDFEPRAVAGPTGSIVQTGYWGTPPRVNLNCIGSTPGLVNLATPPYEGYCSYDQDPLACVEYSEISDPEASSEMEDPSEESPTSEQDSDYEVRVTRSSCCNLRRAYTMPSPKREEKNAKERLRIRNKKQALAKIWQLIASSDFIDEDSKRQRITEEFTLKQCTRLINLIKTEIGKYGHPSRVQQPFA